MSGNAHQRKTVETAIAKAFRKKKADEVMQAPVVGVMNTPTRFFKFFDHGAVQTLLGILGGLVGTLLDGRYLGLLCLWIAYAVNRSKALQGLRAKNRLAVYVVAIVTSAGGLYSLGAKLNQSKPHTYTPSDYAFALRNGTTLPVVQQVTNIYNVATAPSKKPIVNLSEWRLINQNAKGVLFQSEMVNIGDATAINAEGVGRVYIRPQSTASENMIFEELEGRVFDKNGMKNDLPPGKEYRRYASIYGPPATAEIVQAVNSGAKVAYLPMVVSYTDDNGNVYLSEICMYRGTQMNALQYCPGHNEIKIIKKP